MLWGTTLSFDRLSFIPRLIFARVADFLEGGDWIGVGGGGAGGGVMQ